MAALEAAVTGTNLPGFVSGGTVQPDKRAQDAGVAPAAEPGASHLQKLVSRGSSPISCERSILNSQEESSSGWRVQLWVMLGE